MFEVSKYKKNMKFDKIWGTKIRGSPSYTAAKI